MAEFCKHTNAKIELPGALSGYMLGALPPVSGCFGNGEPCDGYHIFSLLKSQIGASVAPVNKQLVHSRQPSCAVISVIVGVLW